MIPSRWAIFAHPEPLGFRPCPCHVALPPGLALHHSSLQGGTVISKTYTEALEILNLYLLPERACREGKICIWRTV